MTSSIPHRHWAKFVAKKISKSAENFYQQTQKINQIK
jgi:hypothetical protein